VIADDETPAEWGGKEPADREKDDRKECRDGMLKVCEDVGLYCDVFECIFPFVDDTLTARPYCYTDERQLITKISNSGRDVRTRVRPTVLTNVCI
jgi:hypothetical protein